MNNHYKLNVGSIIVLIGICYLAYYLLLHDNSFNTSISAIIERSHNLAVKEHLLVLALLPIYIAAMIFGACLLGVYLGTALQHLFIRTKIKFVDEKITR